MGMKSYRLFHSVLEPLAAVWHFKNPPRLTDAIANLSWASSLLM